MTSRTVVSEITHNDSKYPKLSLINMNIHEMMLQYSFLKLFFSRSLWPWNGNDDGLCVRRMSWTLSESGLQQRMRQLQRDSCC